MNSTCNNQCGPGMPQPRLMKRVLRAKSTCLPHLCISAQLTSPLPLSLDTHYWIFMRPSALDLGFLLERRKKALTQHTARATASTTADSSAQSLHKTASHLNMTAVESRSLCQCRQRLRSACGGGCTAWQVTRLSCACP